MQRMSERVSFPEEHEIFLPNPSRSTTHEHDDNTTLLKETKKVQSLAWIITLSSFSWGYAFAVLNVCLLKDVQGSLLNDIPLDTLEQQFATSLVLIGAWAGALVAGSSMEIYGRKKVLTAANVLFVIGACCCTFAPGRLMLYFGRLVLGLACGAVAVVPVLLTEISPDSIRGQITTLHQLQITLGILASGLIGYIFVNCFTSGWRIVHGFLLVPSILPLVLHRSIPESPRWSSQRHPKISTATAGYPDLEHDHDMSDITTTPYSGHPSPGLVSWSKVFSYRQPMIVGTCLVFLQAMTGINTVILYSAKIFAYAGVDNPVAVTATIGLVNVLTTIVSIYLIDSYGRRILLLIGTAIMVFSLFVLSLSLSQLDEYIQLRGILAVASALTFVIGFAIGFGSVVWVLLNEILPTVVRSRAIGFFMAISYLCNIFIATSTLTFIDILGSGSNPEKNGIAKMYFFFSMMSLLAWIFIYFGVPETKYLNMDEDENREE